MSSGTPPKIVPLPQIFNVPLVQHLGAPAKLAVDVGAVVKRGDVLGRAEGFVSASVHAPTSGKVKAIEMMSSPTGRMVQHVVIEADGRDERGAIMPPMREWKNVSSKEIVNRIAEAGIVGMGGAGFPTHVKLSPPPDKKIKALILNGAECEPYLTSDHSIMTNCTSDIWEGAKILGYALGVEKIYIAIESNKSDAIKAFEQIDVSQDDIDAEVVILKTHYPHGSEKLQIYATLGLEVPSGGLPSDVGCVVENIGTVLAVYNAVVNGWASDERFVTVTGESIAAPGNFIARVGMSFEELIKAAGGFKGTPCKIIAGGPMMGFSVSGTGVSVTKTTSGILALNERDLTFFTAMACISCGRCTRVCPMRLLPAEMIPAIEAGDIDTVVAMHIADCYECGCCSYVCPARRPLVQHLRRAKGAIAIRKMREQK